MAKGISISVASDTRDFLRGVRTGVIDPVEDAARALEDVQRSSDQASDGLSDVDKWGSRAGDSLTDLAREGERSGDKLERAYDGTEKSLDGVRKAGDRAGDKLEQSFEDARKEAGKVERAADAMGDAIAAGARKGGRALQDDVQGGTRLASESVDEFKDEAKSNLSEVVSSFDGSFQSIGDLVQGTLGGIVGSLGPLGAAAGAAGAVGVGLIIAAMEAGGAESEAMRQKVSDLTAELIETGTLGGPSVEYVVDKLKELATTTEDGVDSLSDLYKLSDSAASGFDKIAQAYAGNTDGLDELIKKEKEHQRSLEDEAAAIDVSTDSSYGSALSKAEDSAKVVAGLEEVRKTADAARLGEEAYAASGAAELEAKAERTEEYASSIAESLTEAGSDWEEYADKETGALDLEAYNANIEARVQAMENYRANMAGLQGKISDEALAYLQTLGADAAPLLQAYVDAPLDQQQRTAANWAALGATAASSYTSDLKAGIPSEVKGPLITTEVQDFTADFERQIGLVKGRRIQVQADVITRIGNQTI